MEQLLRICVFTSIQLFSSGGLIIHVQEKNGSCSNPKGCLVRSLIPLKIIDLSLNKCNTSWINPHGHCLNLHDDSGYIYRVPSEDSFLSNLRSFHWFGRVEDIQFCGGWCDWHKLGPCPYLQCFTLSFRCDSKSVW